MSSLSITALYCVWSTLKYCLLLSAPIVLYGLLWFINMVFIKPLFDPLRHIPGPNGAKFESHLPQVLEYAQLFYCNKSNHLDHDYSPDITPEIYDEWRKRYGPTFRFHGFGKVCTLRESVSSIMLNSSPKARLSCPQFRQGHDISCFDQIHL